MTELTSDKLIAVLETIDAKIRVDHIDPDADLFIIGLDSLDMMNFFFAIEEQLGVTIEIDSEEYSPTEWSTINKIIKKLSEDS